MREDPSTLTPAAARARFRAGERTPTTGWCAGATQANLIAVPREAAYDLLLFTQRNPRACPVLDVTEPGSVTTERRLLDADIPVRHVGAGRNVPMYATDVPCRPAGRFHGPLVVTMRGIPGDLVADAVQVTSRFPTMHGAPVQVGDPAGLGIADLEQPDYGDPPVLHDGDVPVFWACGVTPQAAVVAAGVEFAITHAPGQMFVSDLDDASFET